MTVIYIVALIALQVVASFPQQPGDAVTSSSDASPVPTVVETTTLLDLNTTSGNDSNVETLDSSDVPLTTKDNEIVVSELYTPVEESTVGEETTIAATTTKPSSAGSFAYPSSLFFALPVCVRLATTKLFWHL